MADCIPTNFNDSSKVAPTLSLDTLPVKVTSSPNCASVYNEFATEPPGIIFTTPCFFLSSLLSLL